MTPELTRLLIVGVVVVAAVIVALILNRFKQPPHPDLTVQPDGDRPGVVLFTSLDCSTCKEAISVLRGSGVPFREVTHELEPQRFEAWHVLAVPLTVIVGADSAVVDAITGVPKPGRLTKSIRRAGIGAEA